MSKGARRGRRSLERGLPVPLGHAVAVELDAPPFPLVLQGGWRLPPIDALSAVLAAPEVGAADADIRLCVVDRDLARDAAAFLGSHRPNEGAFRPRRSGARRTYPDGSDPGLGDRLNLPGGLDPGLGDRVNLPGGLDPELAIG